MRPHLILAALVILFALGVGFRLETLPYPPDSRFSDASISRYPDALYFQRSLVRHQTLPLWNPHLMGGQPFAANVGTKTFYPFTWLLLVLPVPLHISLMTLFHLWLGGVGMGFWARQQGISQSSSWVAVLGYTFAPKLIAHAGAGHTDLLIAMAWLPWLLLSLGHLVRSPQKKISIVCVAGCATLIFMGAIQLLPYLFGLAALHFLSLLWQTKKRLQHLAAVMGALLLGVGLAGAQWIPLWELRGNLTRGEIRPEDAALASLKPAQLIGLLIGDHGGNQETLTYTGICLLILALSGLVLRPRENRIWWAAILLAIFYSLGENFFLWRGIVEVFPQALLFRVPSRAWFLVAFLLPYLAAFGAQSLLANPPDSAPARLGIVGLVGFGLSCAVGSVIALQGTEIEFSALLALFFLPLVSLWIGLIIFKKLDAKWALPLLWLLVLADGLWIGKSMIEGRAGWLNPEAPALIADLAKTGGRIYTPDYAIPQQDTAYWGIARLDGVDPFQMANFIGLTAQMTGVPREGYSTTVPALVVLAEDESSRIYQNAPMNPRKLGAWGVEWVITQYPLAVDGLQFIQQEGDLYFYRNDFAWGGGVILDWESPNRVRQSIDSDLGEIRTVVKAPGWQTLAGNSAGRDPFSLPPLNQTYVYRPLGIRVGLALSGLSLLIALGLLAWGRYN